jgi:tRNA 5-methylaminomethyl-2-thiouridine biosynthesis bifunctional protein
MPPSDLPPASDLPPDLPPDPAGETGASPRLTWSDDGAPRSGRFGDVYFSADDGLAESRAVFLAGCGLPDAWAGRDRFTVAELGFGTGLNILALLDLWKRSPGAGRLHVFSIEAFPLNRDEAARALAAWPELADITAILLARWPDGTPGFHRIDLPEFSATLDLAIGDAAWALEQWSGQADAWFLDGFSPALNPQMWSDAVLDGVAARSAPGARLATFTVAGAVRRGLAERGFQVDKRPGHGRKRERLEAFLPTSAQPGPVPAPAAPTRVVVIGAGVAGASVARALVAAGASVTVIEADRPGAGGSGFPAALVTPRLDAGDAAIAGLHGQALTRARDLYAAVPDAILARGVLQLEQADRDAVRHAKVAAQPIWPEGQMRVLDAAAASARTGEPLTTGGLLMAGALTVAPATILSAWLGAVAMIRGEAASVAPLPDGGWQVLDAAGSVLAEADAVVIAAGWGTAALVPDLDLRPVRGQANWVEGVQGPAIAWGGYAAPTATGLLFGATHDRDDTAVDVRETDSARNLATLATRLPRLADAASGAPLQARAAIRATTRDRLPVCGAVANQPGLYVLGGLGSRGFCVAPLLGEHLAAVITRTPSPLPAALASRISPDRFDR